MLVISSKCFSPYDSTAPVTNVSSCRGARKVQLCGIAEALI